MDVPVRSVCVEKYRSKQMNQWLALVWSVWRLALPPLPLSFPLCFVLRSLSLLSSSPSLPIALLSFPGSPPSARLPAAYKHTAHFCLAARLACSLEPAAEDWEDLRHACGSLPTCLCVLDHWCLYPAAQVCVFVHVCLRAEIGWGGVMGTSIFLITQGPQQMCVYMRQDTSPRTNVHTLILTHWFCDCLIPCPNSVCFTVSVWTSECVG